MLADCPGHVQYTRNTVTGSSTADALVLLVDARKGVLEQTRRHLAVAALMRVPHVVIAVNKIDLVDHSEDVFRTRRRRGARHRHASSASPTPTPCRSPPSSVTTSSTARRTRPGTTAPRCSSCSRPCRPTTDPVHESFRMPVQLVIRPQGAARSPEHVEYRGYAGQLASGSVRVGDEVVVLPSGSRTTVAGIDLGERPLDVAVAPQSVTLRLADDVDVSRGDLIAALPSDPVPLRQEVTAARLLARRRRPCARAPGCSSSTARARCSPWSARSTAGSTSTPCAWPPPTGWRSTTSAGSPCASPSPLPVEDYSTSRRGGAFLLVDPDDGRTLAAVMADAVAPGEHPR